MKVGAEKSIIIFITICACDGGKSYLLTDLLPRGPDMICWVYNAN